MNLFRTCSTRSPVRRNRIGPWLGCPAVVALLMASTLVRAEPGQRITALVSFADGVGISVPPLATGGGLSPWRTSGAYQPTRTTGTGTLDLQLASVKHKNRFGATLAQFDTGSTDEGLRFGMAGSLAGQRLLLRSQLHASRLRNPLGSQVLPGQTYRIFSEIGLAFRLRHDLAIGAEYRFEPDNSKPAGPFGSRAREGAWKDLFISWSLNSSVSLTAAFVDLGSLVRTPGEGRQTGHYLSAEFRY